MTSGGASRTGDAGALVGPAVLQTGVLKVACRCGGADRVDQGAQPWSKLPLWLPSSDAGLTGFMRLSLQRADAHGLKTRPLRDTPAAVMDKAWPGPDDKRRKGRLDRQREAQLIAQWQAGTSPSAG